MRRIKSVITHLISRRNTKAEHTLIYRKEEKEKCHKYNSHPSAAEIGDLHQENPSIMIAVHQDIYGNSQNYCEQKHKNV